MELVLHKYVHMNRVQWRGL